MDKRVLVVDDDPAIQRLLAKHLMSGGHEVLLAANGIEAMHVLLAEAPPIVITDWSMPQMDGPTLCRTIRSHEGIGFTYVIVLTAHRDEDSIVAAFEAGADDFLVKPVHLRELLARLRAGERIVELQAAVEKRNCEVQRFNAQMAIINNELENANRRLNELATTDELTGLTNRREAMTQLNRLWAVSVRQDQPLSCVALDIDHFKSFNDRYGHDVGDLVLKEVSGTLKATSRAGETVARMGGEEFLVICPGARPKEAAKAAERFRRSVQALRIMHDGSELAVQISLGVAGRTGGMEKVDELLKLADEALYTSKRTGRNRVTVAGTEHPTPERQQDSSPDPVATDRSTKIVSFPCSTRRSADSLSVDDTTAKPKVLLVDDEASIRALYRKHLEPEGYQIVEAGNGIEALEMVEQDPPDLIILDAMMPEMDGHECARRLKSNPATRHIPLMIVSARSGAEDIEAGLSAGADDYITKPVRPKEFVLRIRSMAALRQSQKELLRSNETRGEQTRALSLLLDFSRDLSGYEDLNAVLETIVTVTSELTCSRCVSVLLPDPDNRYLIPAKSIGLGNRIPDGFCIPTGVGLIGEVFRSGGTTTISTDEQRRDRVHECEAPLCTDTSMISAALVGSKNVVGVLNVSRRFSGGTYTPLDVEYIDLIRNIAGAAIHDVQTRQARDEARDSVVVALAKLAEHRDPETGKHLDRVTRFSVLIAETLRDGTPHCDLIDDEFLRDLVRAVPLHDIGKVAIPDRILLKPGRLTEEEFEVIKSHAEIGARTLRSLIERTPRASFLSMAEEIARGHHEWFDGSGYPGGVAGQEIPLSARIAAVADVYDAITTKRVYKDAMSHLDAVAIIQQASGRQFDPVIVEAFYRRESDFAKLAAELADDGAEVDRQARREPALRETPDPQLIGTC